MENIQAKKSYDEIPEHDWADWHWQMRNRLSSVDELRTFINLADSELSAMSFKDNLFRVELTPYFASLMDREDPTCPIRRQVIPSIEETLTDIELTRDPLSEEESSPNGASRIFHRYPDRAILLVHTECAAYCRFCTRSRIVGRPLPDSLGEGIKRGLKYISEHREIRDVLLTGGDPLLLSDAILDSILSQLREIPHVEIIRISTRLPIFLPQRITAELVNVLRKHHPLWVNINVNHPKEITTESSAALSRLANAGIPLGSQTVLMAGINDCSNIILKLVHELLKNRVRPYYLYQCDLTVGTAHFRTPVAKGIEIIESLRGHTSGLAVPTFVIDAPDGGGKTPLSPNYVISASDRAVVIRTFEGRIIRYPETRSYLQHDSSNCQFCLASQNSDKRTVADLLH